MQRALPRLVSRCLPLALACLSVLPAAGCRKRELVADMDYDDPKQALAEMDDAKRDAWVMPDRVIRSLGITRKDAVVADIGAGSGYFSRRLAREVPGGVVYAVDVDDEFRGYIEQNRESWGTPNIEPHLAFYDDPALPESVAQGRVGRRCECADRLRRLQPAGQQFRHRRHECCIQSLQHHVFMHQLE